MYYLKLEIMHNNQLYGIFLKVGRASIHPLLEYSTWILVLERISNSSDVKDFFFLFYAQIQILQGFRT